MSFNFDNFITYHLCHLLPKLLFVTIQFLYFLHGCKSLSKFFSHHNHITLMFGFYVCVVLRGYLMQLLNIK